MGRLIKWLIYLVALGFLGLVAYIQIAPYFGEDFSPERREIRLPVELERD